MKKTTAFVIIFTVILLSAFILLFVLLGTNKDSQELVETEQHTTISEDPAISDVEQEASSSQIATEESSEVPHYDEPAVIKENITLGSLEVVQVVGDEEKVMEALNPLYQDYTEVSSLYFEYYLDGFYYVDDYTNNISYKIDSTTFTVEVLP